MSLNTAIPLNIDLPQSRVELANGIALDVVDIGPRDAPTLIFLHGFPENHRTWRHQLVHFSKHYRCIAPDQRGYCGSSRPAGVENYETDKLIGDIFLLADSLEVERFTIVGHDWGGAIAWAVAIGSQGARVERAILANAPHPLVFPKLLWTNHQQRQSSQYMRAFRDTSYDALIADKGLGGFLNEVTEWQDTDAMETDERDSLLQSWEDREAGITMLNWYRAAALDVPPMDAPFALPQGFTPPTLPKLAIPTLVIWGMDDLALPAENIEGLDEHIDDLTLAKVTDCGHFVTWGAPEAVNRAMESFLKR